MKAVKLTERNLRLRYPNEFSQTQQAMGKQYTSKNKKEIQCSHSAEKDSVMQYFYSRNVDNDLLKGQIQVFFWPLHLNASSLLYTFHQSASFENYTER